MITIIHFTVNLLASFLLASAAVWGIRVRRRCPDQLLLFIVFACGGIPISFEVLSYVGQLQFASVRVAIIASVLVAMLGVRFMRQSGAGGAKAHDFFIVREGAAQHHLGVTSKDPSQ